MIRPLTAVITSNGLLNVRNHMQEILCHDVKIENVKYFIRCLNKNPITAFGYNLQGKDSKLYNQVHFSKHDVIRALDFWIEHWVYQNQLEAAFTDTVNVDHEITLKELILVREKIMKMTADTKFTRERIKEPITSAEQIRKQKKVVFTQAVYSEDSSLDPFCHKVLEMTKEEYYRYKNGIMYLPNATQTDIENLQRVVNGAGNLISNTLREALAGAAGSWASIMAEMERRAREQVPLPTGQLQDNFRDRNNRFSFGDLDNDIDPPSTPLFQMGDLIRWDEESNRFVRAEGNEPDRIRLSTETQSPEFLQWVTTGTFTIPDRGNFTAGDSISLRNDDVNVIFAHGTVAERIEPGDTITLNGNGEWVKAQRLVTTGATFPASIPTQEVRDWDRDSGLGAIIRPENELDRAFNILEQNGGLDGRPRVPSSIDSYIITYDNMSLAFLPITSTLGSNEFMTLPVRLVGNGGSEIQMDLFMETTGIMDRLSDFTTHSIQIRPLIIGDNFLTIDGQRYHTTNISISHSPMRPFSLHFRDLWISSTQATASSTGTTFEINFLSTMGLTRNTISLTLHEPIDGEFMRQSFRDDEARAWDLEILGNNQVRIGGDQYTVLEPIQITMN